MPPSRLTTLRPRLKTLLPTSELRWASMSPSQLKIHTSRTSQLSRITSSTRLPLSASITSKTEMPLVGTNLKPAKPKIRKYSKTINLLNLQKSFFNKKKREDFR
jgi:hypothetical protein